MSRRIFVVAGAVLLLLAFPRASSAQWWEFIREMSGPGMIGVFGGCQVDLAHPSGCAEKHVGPVTWGDRLDQAAGRETTRPAGPRYWLTLQGGYFTSFRNTPPDTRVHMLAAESIVEVRSAGATGRGHLLYHGVVGYSFNHFLGRRFNSFQRSALRFTPLGYRRSFSTWRFDAAYNLRFYPTGVNQDDFIRGRQGGDRDSEFVHSFSVGVSR